MLNPGHNNHPELSSQIDRDHDGDHDRGRGGGDRDDHRRNRDRDRDRDRDHDRDRDRSHERYGMWQCWSQDRWGGQYQAEGWERWNVQMAAHDFCVRYSGFGCFDLGCNRMW
jgi:hypothetical protein